MCLQYTAVSSGAKQTGLTSLCLCAERAQYGCEKCVRIGSKDSLNLPDRRDFFRFRWSGTRGTIQSHWAGGNCSPRLGGGPVAEDRGVAG